MVCSSDSELTCTYCVEAVIDDVFEVLAESNLPHELVLVAVHTSQLAHMGKRVLQAIGKLVGIHIAQPVLHMRVHHQLRETQDFTTEMESIAKSAFLAFLGCEGLNWLQVEVVIQMEVVQVFPMDKQVEHVVTLPTDLQACFNPIQFSGLEKLGRFERPKQIPRMEKNNDNDIQPLPHPLSLPPSIPYFLLRALGALCFRAFST